MASEKKVVLVFTSFPGQELAAASSPALAKFVQKGVLFSKVDTSGNAKARAGAGADSGESLWDAAAAQDFNVAALGAGFDMCVIDAAADPAGLEKVMAEVAEASDRSTLVVLVADGAVLLSGPGMAKGRIVEQALDVAFVAPTVAYVANFPVPAQCVAPVAYAALKDVNYKLSEIRKLQTTINNLEAAIERKSRQPWDKHDCA